MGCLRLAPPGEPIIMHLLQKYWVFQLYEGPSVLWRFNTLNKMGALFFFFFFHWARGEKQRQSLAWNFHKQWKHITQPPSSSLTQNTLYYTLKCLWHKKHISIPSKGKCHANDTFPTRRGIYCGQDRPAGSGYNQTGTFRQSGVFHSWSEFRDRNTSKKVVVEQIKPRGSLK